MITGDKPNTAISIGRSTGIIDPKTRDHHIVKLDLDDNHRDVKSVRSFMKESIERIKQDATIPFCLCVTGNMFSFITTSQEEEEEYDKGKKEESLINLLVVLATSVNSVIFCRVFPKQKVLFIRQSYWLWIFIYFTHL